MLEFVQHAYIHAERRITAAANASGHIKSPNENKQPEVIQIETISRARKALNL